MGTRVKEVQNRGEHLRRKAKAVNFGMIFGQTPEGLSQSAMEQFGVEITREEAIRARDAFFRLYPDFRNWMNRTTERKHGVENILARTPLGRVRRLPFGYLGNDRLKLNTPIQGGAVEVLLSELARLPEALDGLDAKLVHTVHDEIILEVADQDLEEARIALVKTMTQGMLDIFPQAPTADLVEVNAGPDWAQAK
jgi:DNA polymerase I